MLVKATCVRFYKVECQWCWHKLRIPIGHRGLSSGVLVTLEELSQGGSRIPLTVPDICSVSRESFSRAFRRKTVVRTSLIRRPLTREYSEVFKPFILHLLAIGRPR